MYSYVFFRVLKVECIVSVQLNILCYFFSYHSVFYEDWSFMMDEERSSMIPTMAAGNTSHILLFWENCFILRRHFCFSCKDFLCYLLWRMCIRYTFRVNSKGIMPVYATNCQNTGSSFSISSKVFQMDFLTLC